MARRRTRLLAVCTAVALLSLIPLPTDAIARPTVPARPLVSLPATPDLTRCGGWQDEDCRPLLHHYGRRAAARLAATRPEGASFPAWRTSPAVTDPCRPAAFPGAICGHVDVPFDRSDPSQGTIAIAFELYVHTDPGPAESAILVNFGGPGGGTIPSRGGAFYLFGPNLGSHDLLLIDDRGRGFSHLIDCPMLQHAVGSIPEQLAECAAILGDTVDRYGSGDVAMDTDAVREELGYELVDYYGVSYGGADIGAYATRFPEHIRSLVLDAPWGATAILEEFTDANLYVTSTLDNIRLVCERSPSCRAGRSDPVGDFASLVEQVRDAPVSGTGTSWDGSRMHVTVDNKFIIEYLMLPFGNFTNNAEISAAAAALERGDAVPLLRLAAEGYYPLCCQELPDPPPPPPAGFSLGSYVTTFCADNHWEWNWTSPVEQRFEEHSAALAAAPPELFLPFTGAEATDSTFVSPAYCIYWPDPTGSSPIAPPNPVYPEVPTLVIGGDLDNIVPLQQTRWVADLFPNSHLVEIPGAGHGAAFFSSCALGLVQEFVDTLELGDTSCASRPEFEIPAVGEFPLVAAEAPVAQPTPGGDNEAGKVERRVASVTAAAVRDVLARGNLAFSGQGELRSRGLRGGRVDFDFRGANGFNWVIDLRDVRFAEDVSVSGVVRWLPNSKLRAFLTIAGPGTAGGTLLVRSGNFPVRRWIEVTGTLGGDTVDVRVEAV